MKKSVRIAVLLVIALFTIALVGCGAKDDLIGTWETEVSENGISVKVGYIFNKDGSADVTSNGQSILSILTMLGGEAKMTWHRSGDTIEMTTSATVNGKTTDETENIKIIELKGKTLTIEGNDGKRYTLSKK